MIINQKQRARLTSLVLRKSNIQTTRQFPWNRRCRLDSGWKLLQKDTFSKVHNQILYAIGWRTNALEAHNAYKWPVLLTAKIQFFIHLSSLHTETLYELTSTVSEYSAAVKHGKTFPESDFFTENSPFCPIQPESTLLWREKMVEV